MKSLSLLAGTTVDNLIWFIDLISTVVYNASPVFANLPKNRVTRKVTTISWYRLCFVTKGDSFPNLDDQ